MKLEYYLTKSDILMVFIGGALYFLFGFILKLDEWVTVCIMLSIIGFLIIPLFINPMKRVIEEGRNEN